MKKALITGATGQDAAYLAEHLLRLDYDVVLTDRRISADVERHWRLKELGILNEVKIVYASMSSYDSLVDVLAKEKPDEIYGLAAQSFVTNSFEDEFSTMDINAYGTHRLLKAILAVSPKSKFYNAASSEQFGKVEQIPQTEKTPFHPRSPYGISKCAAFEFTRHYRERYGLWAVSGILFNHESPLRGEQFVTRKIVLGILKCLMGGPKLKLGNMDAKRDWGFAGDYCVAMHLMLNSAAPEDYVIATGETHSVEEFFNTALAYTIEFTGKNLNREDVLEIDPSLLRPCEVDLLVGDAWKAKSQLDWTPDVTFHELVKMMVEVEMGRLGL